MLNEAHSNDVQTTEIMNWAIRAGAPEAVARGARMVHYKVARPQEDIESETLEFSREQAERLIEQGYNDHHAVLRDLMLVS